MTELQRQERVLNETQISWQNKKKSTWKRELKTRIKKKTQQKDNRYKTKVRTI